MIKPLLTLTLTTVFTCSFAQIGGGAATYGQQGRSGADTARAAELAKRNVGSNDGGKYTDASVLMNVEADEYVAVFAINAEGKTLAEARGKVDSAAKSFSTDLAGMKVGASDIYIDFVGQNRIYGYEGAGTDVAKEVVVGFEVNKNISIHYRDKNKLDDFASAAAKAGIFDLIKVDYIVNDVAKIHKQLLEEAAKIIKRKEAEQEQLLGVKSGQVQQAYSPQYSTYYPTEMYNSYVAQGSEELSGYRQNQNIQRARKTRTFYFDGLDGKDFDSVINPVLTEPSVQFTVYVRVRY